MAVRAIGQGSAKSRSASTSNSAALISARPVGRSRLLAQNVGDALVRGRKAGRLRAATEFGDRAQPTVEIQQARRVHGQHSFELCMVETLLGVVPAQAIEHEITQFVESEWRAVGPRRAMAVCRPCPA